MVFVCKLRVFSVIFSKINNKLIGNDKQVTEAQCIFAFIENVIDLHDDRQLLLSVHRAPFADSQYTATATTKMTQ